MKISSRFSVAIHIIAVLSLTADDICTSDKIADSVNTNPVVIRRVIGLLKKANLVRVKLGCGGACLLKSLDEISLYDVYKAVEVVDEGKLFQIHEDSNEACVVGANLHKVLAIILSRAQVAMEDVLAEFTMADIIEEIVAKSS